MTAWRKICVTMPKSSFIGFAVHRLYGQRARKKRGGTFGDYVSTYNFAQSVEDGATVPLYYENRSTETGKRKSGDSKDLEKVMDFL